MGNCWFCFKCSSQPTNPDSSSATENKEDTMELKRLFQPNSVTKESMTSIESHAHLNKKLSTISALNNIGSDNFGSVPVSQNNIKLSKVFYSKLPSTFNCTNVSQSVDLKISHENKYQKEISETKINLLFDQYKDLLEDIIFADGIERLCDDLHLSPDDFEVLVLAWKLDAEQMCQFTRNEFLNGLKSMCVDSIHGMQTRLPAIVEELVNNSEMFKDLYRFTFRFGLDVASGQRILPVDMAVVLWKLVFTIREPPLLSEWLAFIQNHHVRGIPRDTWNMFLNFSEVIGNNLGAYDDAEAWPSLFDDFVEYENDQLNQNIIKDNNSKNMIINKN